MKHFQKDILLENENRHFVSEAHIRVQILTLKKTVLDQPVELYDKHHGEVLLIALQGNGVVNTNSNTQSFSEGDQILINNGEAFNVLPDKSFDQIRVQFVWTPGLNSCKECWTINNRFYRDAE